MVTKNLLGLLPKLIPLEKAWVLYLLDSNAWMRFRGRDYDKITIAEIGLLDAYKAIKAIEDSGVNLTYDVASKRALSSLQVKLEKYVEEK